MRSLVRLVMLPVILGCSAWAQNGPFTFEGLPDSTVLTNQLAGAMFSNAIILASGISLNELEFPPRDGSNVVSDNAGPMTVVFTAPLRGFGAYFTYSVPLTLQAFDSANNLLATANSAYSSNEAISGAPGSHPNELLDVSSGTGIAKIVITGSGQGTSFTLDDAGFYIRCDLNQDEFTNITDAQIMINEALGVAKAADDLNQDGRVDLVDAQIVINAALGGACEAK